MDPYSEPVGKASTLRSLYEEEYGWLSEGVYDIVENGFWYRAVGVSGNMSNDRI